MHPAMTLRPFTAADARIVATWFSDAPEAVAFAGSGARWPVDPAELLARADLPDIDPLSAVDPDRPDVVLGHVEIVRVSPTAGRLARIALAPEVRGRGLSTAMLLRAIDHARSAGIRTLTLFVVPGNAPALRAYARVGFVEIAPDPDHAEYVRLVRDI